MNKSLQQTIEAVRKSNIGQGNYVSGEWERLRNREINWKHLGLGSAAALAGMAVSAIVCTYIDAALYNHAVLSANELGLLIASPEYAEHMAELGHRVDEIAAYYNALPDTPENKAALMREALGTFIFNDPESHKFLYEMRARQIAGNFKSNLAQCIFWGGVAANTVYTAAANSARIAYNGLKP